ncbi:hypothetical protein [Psychroflexus salis]|uniref:Uncharacterized protein n=1 Tax=Psychroflexus salis TaxID=1526574 RepID=A0A916ZU35_9FLAO|nr:hypothetical protein [Psychroflexus salis]GGE14238.1 hypothetical protein GCM10010831_14510 [Psychroflexus salis]
MWLDNKINKFILNLDTCLNTAYIHHKYVDLYTPFQSVYFSNVSAALNYIEDLQPLECALIICSYQLSPNYTGLDFIEDVKFLYKKENKTIPFKILMLGDKFTSATCSTYSNSICLKNKPLIKDELLQFINNLDLK